MSLTDLYKYSCDICGCEIPTSVDGNKDSGRICDSCAKKFTGWFSNRTNISLEKNLRK